MLLTSFSSALSEQNTSTRQFCLTLHLKVFRVSDYCSLPHFLYIGTRLIRTPRGMPYWDTPNTVRRNDWSKKPMKWNLCKRKRKPFWIGHSTRVKHGRKSGLIKIKHASRHFATVSSNKIVLICNLQVTRGYENKLIGALIWASLSHWKNQRFRLTRHYWSWLNEIEHCLGRHF